MKIFDPINTSKLKKKNGYGWSDFRGCYPKQIHYNTKKKNKIRMVRYQRLTLFKFIKAQKNKVRMVCYQKLPP